MKNLILILALFIGLSVTAQDKPFIYKLKFDNQSEVEMVIDSTMEAFPVDADVIRWKQNIFNSDSTAVYEDGIFYDVISWTELPQLNQYILDPYPTNFNHCFMGWDETNAIFKRKE